MTKEDFIKNYTKSNILPTAEWLHRLMDDWADQQNKDLKEIVLQLQKDFVLKLEAAKYEGLSGYSTYLRTNWQPIEDVMWWNEKTNEFASSEELYSYYFIYLQSKQITND